MRHENGNGNGNGNGNVICRRVLGRLSPCLSDDLVYVAAPQAGMLVYECACTLVDRWSVGTKEGNEPPITPLLRYEMYRKLFSFSLEVLTLIAF